MNDNTNSNNGNGNGDSIPATRSQRKSIIALNDAVKEIQSYAFANPVLKPSDTYDKTKVSNNILKLDSQNNFMLLAGCYITIINTEPELLKRQGFLPSMVVEVVFWSKGSSKATTYFNWNKRQKEEALKVAEKIQTGFGVWGLRFTARAKDSVKYFIPLNKHSLEILPRIEHGKECFCDLCLLGGEQ